MNVGSRNGLDRGTSDTCSCPNKARTPPPLEIGALPANTRLKTDAGRCTPPEAADTGAKGVTAP